MSCTATHHAELVNRHWHRLIPVGTMGGVELANCPDCPEGHRFTLSRPLPIVRYWLVRTSDVVRVEYADGHMTVADAHDEDVVALFDAALAGDADERFAGWDASESAAWAACEAAWAAKEAA